MPPARSGAAPRPGDPGDPGVERSLARLLDASPDLVGSVNLDRRVEYLNAAGRRMLGLGACEELAELDLLALYPPPLDRMIREVALPAALATGRWSGEVTLLSREGRQVAAHQVIVAHQGARGERLLAIFARDVTERRRERESEHYLARVLDLTPDFVGTMTTDHRALYINAAGRAMLGIGEHDDLAGVEPMSLHPGWARPFVEGALPTVLGGQTWVGESALVTRSGREIPVLQVMFVHRGAADELLFTTIARDISELKQVQATLERAKADAEQANRAKSEFLANMSHELRTPLSSVIGFAEMLADRHYGEINERQRQCLDSIVDSGHHLLELINDILDLAKIEAGRLALNTVELDAAPLIADLASAMQGMAERKGIHFAVGMEEGSPPIVADPRRLKQIVLNLLSNSVKFTPEGGWISVALRSATALGEPEGIWLAVADSGIGIRADDLGRLFQPFEQLDGSYRRNQQGTGLGLALTRRLAELHGGRVWAESQGEGRGSIFHVVLPAGGPAQAAR